VVNQQPLTPTVALTLSNTVSSTTRFDVPSNVLTTGRNDVNVALNIDGLTCNDPNSLVEVLISPDSALTLNYQQHPYPADLGLYPFPFAEQSVVEIPVAIVLPDEPTSEDLSIAASIAAGLGKFSQGNINLTAVLASELDVTTRADSHLIVVGQPETNSLLEQLSLPLPLDETTLKPGQGMLAEIVSPWNEFRLVLVAAGLDYEGLAKAGQALNRQAHFLGMRGPAAIILDVLPLSETETTFTASTTLASMGFEDEVFQGRGIKKSYVDFYLPLGWNLEDLPFLMLKFIHADSLDPHDSVIDIYLNRVPIGSTLLNADNATQGELTVTMPAHLLRTGRNRLEMQVELNLFNDDLCDGLDLDRAWAVIRSDSELFLPYSAIDIRADLNSFPHPFSRLAGFNQTLFVLPDEPSSLDFSDLIRLVAQMGTASNQTESISVHVTYASEVDETQRALSHLVLLGRPTENKLLAEINDQLPQPFVPGSDLLQSLAVDDVALLPDPDRDAGLLQLIASPWNEEYSLLAISGTTDGGVKLAYQALRDQAAALQGNLAVVEPVVDPLASGPGEFNAYSIDTRPRASIEPGAGGSPAASQDDLILLTRRWWR
jgi:hypothetical protein